MEEEKNMVIKLLNSRFFVAEKKKLKRKRKKREKKERKKKERKREKKEKKRKKKRKNDNNNNKSFLPVHPVTINHKSVTGKHTHTHTHTHVHTLISSPCKKGVKGTSLPTPPSPYLVKGDYR